MDKLTELKQLGAGLEVISHQYDRNFFKTLTEEMRRIQNLVLATEDKKLTQAMMMTSNLPDIIMKGTGLKVSCYVDKMLFNASMITIPIGSFDVLYGGKVYDGAYAPESALRLFQKYGKVIEGTVDYSKGTVGGMFSEIGLHLSLSDNIVTIPDMTPEELAGIVLHEIGHGWSHISLCHYKMATNLVMVAGISALVSTPDRNRKIAIMTDLENTLGIDIPNKADLIDYEKYEEAYIVMLSAYDEVICSATGASAYDENMSEQIADAYAARHGAGKFVVTGLTKMNKAVDNYVAQRIAERRSRENALWRALCATISTGMTLLFLPVTSPFKVKKYLKIFMTVNWMGGVYDRTKDRYIRLRNESVDALKDQTLSRKIRETILQEIKEMDEVIASVTNEYSMTAKLAVLIRSGQRKQYRAKKLQQDLEALLNNPLYITLAKMKG